MKILLSGASGLVGRNIVEMAPRGVHELLTPTHAELDLLNRAAVLEYLRREQPELVIHAAGLVGGIAVNSRNPRRFLIENLDMGRNLIQGAYESGVKNFINISSTSIYPRGLDTLLTEDMIFKGELDPSNEGYALAKVVGVKLCGYINRESPDCRYKTLIPGNLYGRWDKFNGERAHMIPAAIYKIYRAVTEGSDEVVIWGSGSARREFMYAGDLAECIWFSIENFDRLPDVMNVGLGYDYTVNEYYEAIASELGFKGHFAHDLSKPEGMRQKLTDITRMKNFGWEPKVELRDGIRRTVEFYRKNVLGEKPMDKIGIGWAFVSDAGRKYVNAALDAGRLSQGDMVYRFEKEFARLHDQKYGIALNSGTSALHVGLEAMKEKFGWNDHRLSDTHTHKGARVKSTFSSPRSRLSRRRTHVCMPVSSRSSLTSIRSLTTSIPI